MENKHDFVAYDLPDSAMQKDRDQTYRYLVWQPKETYIVLGRSNNKPQDVLFMEQVKKDNAKVYQRATGGQSVVLSPRMLVVSISEGTKEATSKEHFFCYNQKIIRGLQELEILELCQKGISDIAIGNKKIAGTAMYRNRFKVFYHAVINVGEDLGIFQRYLKYPPTVPEYRRGRSHDEFVTSLVNEGYTIELHAIKKAIEKQLENATWLNKECDKE